MNRLLTLRHWQLFLLLFVLPFALQLAIGGVNETYQINTNGLLLSFAINLLVVGVSVAWLYAMAAGLHRILPPDPDLRMRLGRFRAAMIWCLALFFLYMAAIALLVVFSGGNPFVMLSIFMAALMQGTGVYIGIAAAFLIWFGTMFASIYILYWVSKALCSVELGFRARFGDYIGTFLLFLILPIGIWFIQPRINRLFSHDDAVTVLP